MHKCISFFWDYVTIKARTAELWVIFSYTLCGMAADQRRHHCFIRNCKILLHPPKSVSFSPHPLCLVDIYLENYRNAYLCFKKKVEKERGFCFSAFVRKIQRYVLFYSNRIV